MRRKVEHVTVIGDRLNMYVVTAVTTRWKGDWFTKMIRGLVYVPKGY